MVNGSYSTNGMSEEELLGLASYTQKKLRGSVPPELYGCGIQLRKYGFYPSGLPLYVMSGHGPGQWDTPQNFELGTRFPVMLLSSVRNQQAWKDHSDKPSYVFTSPFVMYRRANNINISPTGAGTLAFFSHSTEGTDMSLDIDQYIDELLNLPDEYHPVSVCLHFEDIKKGSHKPFLERNINCFSAGHWLDPNFIPRFYEIIRNFNYATSNTHGSYLFYAVELGIPFFLHGQRPVYYNFNDTSLPKGEWKPEEIHKQTAYIYELFNDKVTTIGPEQQRLVENELAIHTGVGRIKMARILYGAYFKHQYNLLKSKFRIKSLTQFSFKEALTLTLGAVISRILYLLPGFDNYLRQKQFFDLIYIYGGDVIKQLGKNLVVVKESSIGPYKVVVRRNTSDYIVFKQVLLEEEYKPLVDTVLRLQEANTIEYIIDAGGNIGLTSLYLKKQFPKSKIITLEPDVGNYRCIQENMKLNGIDDIIEVNAALWNKNEDLVIDHTFRGGAEWSLAVKPKKYIEDVSVKAVTLLDLLAEHKFPHIDILKMDIEGAERYIFEDTEKTKMILSKVKYIAIEIHDEFKIKRDLLNQFDINGFVYEEIGETVFGFNRNFDIPNS